MKKFFSVIFIVLIFARCSDDNDTFCCTEPLVYDVSISADNLSIVENGGESTLMLSIDQGANVDVELSFSGTASLGDDYSISTISGSSLLITSLQDEIVEGDETISISINQNDSLNIINGSVTITILDDDNESTDPCAGTTDTYRIELDPNGCGINIQQELGVSSQYSETVSQGNRRIVTNSIPNHNVGMFPNSGNPHAISAQSDTYVVPLNPTDNNSVTYLTNSQGAPAYIFGVLFNAVHVDPIAAEYFMNTSNQELNMDWNISALSSTVNLGTDCNNAHVQPNGTYHHHATPSAYIASLNANGSQPIQIGWAADGYPIYYKYGNKGGSVSELISSYQLKNQERGGDGVSAPDGCPDGTYTQDYEYVAGLGDLDECNGYQDPTLGYIYVITDTYPSLPRCFIATPSGDFRIGM